MPAHPQWWSSAVVIVVEGLNPVFLDDQGYNLHVTVYVVAGHTDLTLWLPAVADC